MAERDQSRARILDAAAATLRTHGYAGSKLSEIARIAGMLAPSLYHHFASKNQLVEEVMLEGIYRNTRHIMAHVEGLGRSASSLQRLEGAITSHIEFVLTGDNYASAVARIFADIPDDMRYRVLAAYANFDNYWRDLIVAAQQEGSARRDLDPTLLRKFLIAMLDSTSSWYRPGKLNPAEIAAQAARLVLTGLAAG